MNLPSGDLEPYARGNIEELRENYIEQSGRQRIRVSSDILGVSKWQEMIAATQANLRERGMMVGRGSRLAKGGVIQSRIIEGTEEDVRFGAFPFGIRTPLTQSDGTVRIHTHPLPSELAHLRTHPISDGDIYAFVNSTNHAEVVLDRGGAHLLVRTRRVYDGIPPAYPPEDLVRSVVDEVKALKEKGRTIDMVKKIAERLQRYGLGYFYRPFYPPFPSMPQEGEEFVEFLNAATANLYPEEN